MRMGRNDTVSLVSGLTEVTDADFATEVIGSDLPVLVQFTAEWCGPCRQLAPVLKEIAFEEGDLLKVVQIDVDRNPQTAISYGVMATPTLLLFQGGEPVRSIVGARPKRRLLADLADVLRADAR
ncbi:thioredoxin family protein [Streptomyces sp. NPDC015171]|uniref:thioredoxin family protein n=1 Tax=Streptomyces sp. NPDC015171 TaxID=3364945 RepID=UPI00370013EB